MDRLLIISQLDSYVQLYKINVFPCILSVLGGIRENLLYHLYFKEMVEGFEERKRK